LRPAGGRAKDKAKDGSNKDARPGYAAKTTVSVCASVATSYGTCALVTCVWTCMRRSQAYRMSPHKTSIAPSSSGPSAPGPLLHLQPKTLGLVLVLPVHDLNLPLSGRMTWPTHTHPWLEKLPTATAKLVSCTACTACINCANTWDVQMQAGASGPIPLSKITRKKNSKITAGVLRITSVYLSKLS
jgi:hypothetical protein